MLNLLSRKCGRSTRGFTLLILKRHLLLIDVRWISLHIHRKGSIWWMRKLIHSTAGAAAIPDYWFYFEFDTVNLELNLQM